MALNKATGNMYSFVTHTWNTVKGACPHNCSYCYMKRWGQQKPIHFDKKELKTDLGSKNFIFVGSSCDMWALGIFDDWIVKTLDKCSDEQGLNRFLFQSKNPQRFLDFCDIAPTGSIYCTTIETNRQYDEMGCTPLPIERVGALGILSRYGVKTFVTIEPIMDFDLEEMVFLIESSGAKQVNIGCDSGNNNLPEPPKEKVLQLITELEKFTTIHNKKNLARILNG